jgi:hypothetical protein
VTPKGADAFITEDGKAGRMVEVIQRGEPAIIVCHWTGIYWNGLEIGFEIFREVVKRLHATFDHLHWMKLSEIARYWAAKELTKITLKRDEKLVLLRAPFACEEFTLSLPFAEGVPHWQPEPEREAQPLQQVATKLYLKPGTWCREGEMTCACVKMPKGASSLGMRG